MQAISLFKKLRTKSMSGQHERDSKELPTGGGGDNPTILQGRSPSKRMNETQVVSPRSLLANSLRSNGSTMSQVPSEGGILSVPVSRAHQDHWSLRDPLRANASSLRSNGSNISQVPNEGGVMNMPTSGAVKNRAPSTGAYRGKTQGNGNKFGTPGPRSQLCRQGSNVKPLPPQGKPPTVPPSQRALPVGCEPDDEHLALPLQALHEEQHSLDNETLWSSNSRSAMWMLNEVRSPCQASHAGALAAPQATQPAHLEQPRTLSPTSLPQEQPRTLSPTSLPQPPHLYNSTAQVHLEFGFKDDVPISPCHETGKVHTISAKGPLIKQPSLQVRPELTYMAWKEANDPPGSGATIQMGEGPKLAPLNFTPQLALFLQMNVGNRGRNPVPGAYGQLRRAFSEELPKRRSVLPEEDGGTSPGAAHINRSSPKSDAARRKEATIGACVDPGQWRLMNTSRGSTLGLQQLPPSPAATGSEVEVQIRRTTSSGNLTISSVGGRTCPICLEENIKSANMETFGCGIHSICAECFKHIAVEQLAQNNIPRCPTPECKMPLESLVALRLLSKEDLDKYLKLALFANPRYMVCPSCNENLFSEVVPPCAETVQCPKCYFVFCTDCRCSFHPNMTCEEAMAKAEAQLIEKGEALAEGVKPCPRCMVPVYKEDDGSCDHMTCANCKQEYCWTCLADRSVIYAHGNHYHMPSCKFFAPYDGEDEYLPDRCVRCALRGKACKKPRVASNAAPLALYSLWDACMTWIRAAMNGGFSWQTQTVRVSI